MTLAPPLLHDRNARSFDELSFALQETQGHFKLLFGHCNYRGLRQQTSMRLLSEAASLAADFAAADSAGQTTLSGSGGDRQIVELQVEPDATSLLPPLLECAMTRPYAAIISDLELAPNARVLLDDLNQRRELLRDRCPFPVVFWLDDRLLSQVVRHVPDLASWATTYAFDIEPEQLIEQIDRFCDRVFERVMTTDSDPFLARYPLIRERDRLELDLGLRRLRRNGDRLTSQLRANVHFAIGRRAYERGKLDVAAEYFRRSLDYWTQRLAERRGTRNGSPVGSRAGLKNGSQIGLKNGSQNGASSAPSGSISLDRQPLQIQWACKQGVLLTHLGLCQIRSERGDRRSRLTEAAATLKRAIAAFKTAKRPELNAATLVFLSEILQDLEAWKPLKAVLRQAIYLHEQHGAPIRLAGDYLMLAQVAVQEQRWSNAQAWATRTVRLLTPRQPAAPLGDRPFLPGFVQLAQLYQALAAKHRRHPIASAVDRALVYLPAMLDDAAHAIDPARYLELLERSRQIYFELGYYREALQCVLKHRSISQQYGFQAFIGIGQIEPQRDAASLQPDGVAVLPAFEEVSREICASGRERDIQAILDLLIRPDRKLITIHGQSGVGKSSLVNAGLVPTLQRTSISGRVVVPVVLSVYADWPDRLARQLDRALKELGYEPFSRPDPDASPARPDRAPYTTALPPEALTSEAVADVAAADSAADSAADAIAHVDRVLQATAELTGNRLALVFVFDQFEEFFFANAEPTQRRFFFQFLDRLLGFPFVKAALSVRDDCLHLLLECDRALSMEVTQGDILKQSSRYYIGNFSPEAAHNLIRSLTDARSTFKLDDDLIVELVRDLSEPLGEVRPIELQIVGFQLQHERITSLAQYHERGPKSDLVRRFLIDAIGHCGPENETAAIEVMFCLTDKNGTRPIRTRADLAQAVKVSADRLDSILDILCDSGLMFALPDVPAYRYQLVHDYLVPFVRQEQERRHTAETEALRLENRQLNHDKELLEQLAEARARRQISERKSRSLLALGAIVSTIGAIAFGVLANVTEQARQRAEIAEHQTALAAVDARNSAAKALWLADDPLNAIVDGLRATRRLAGIDANPDFDARAARANSADNADNTGLDREDLTYVTLQTLNPLLQSVAERNRLEGHANSVLGVEFAPSGEFAASVSWDKSLRVWTPEGRSRYAIPQAHREAVTAVAISPDSQTIVTGGNDRAIKLWDAETGQPIADLKGHRDTITSVAISTDGRWLASASIDGVVILWDFNRQAEVRRFQAHDDWILDVAFAPDGDGIATASRDRTLRLWGLDGQLRDEFAEHAEGLTAVDFSPDGEALVTAAADGTAIVWSRTGEVLARLADHDGWVLDARFSPDSQTIATGDNRHITLWNRDGSERARFDGHRDRIWSLSFDRMSSTLVSGSTDNTVRYWDTEPRALATVTEAGISNVAIGPDGDTDDRTIAVVADDEIVRLYDATGQEVDRLVGHTAPVSTVEFDREGTAIVTAAEDGTVRIWERDTGELRVTLPHGGEVNIAAFSSDGKTVATAGDDGVVRLWDARTGARQRTLYGHTDSALGLAFDPQNELLATTSADRTLRLWSRTGEEIATLSEHASSVNWVAFSPDGTRLATASSDNTIRTWERDGTPLSTLIGHTGPVNGLAFLSERELASVSDDRTLRIWNANKQRALLSFEAHGDRALSVATSADAIYTSGEDGALHQWYLDLESLFEQGCRWVRHYLVTNPSVTPSNKGICDGFVRP
ncbi:MAG: AAA family ATPase [Geitlerinemataceae cyanobacterium]